MRIDLIFGGCGRDHRLFFEALTTLGAVCYVYPENFS
jgi:hypothetical protein